MGRPDKCPLCGGPIHVMQPVSLGFTEAGADQDPNLRDQWHCQSPQCEARNMQPGDVRKLARKRGLPADW